MPKPRAQGPIPGRTRNPNPPTVSLSPPIPTLIRRLANSHRLIITTTQSETDQEDLGLICFTLGKTIIRSSLKQTFIFILIKTDSSSSNLNRLSFYCLWTLGQLNENSRTAIGRGRYNFYLIIYDYYNLIDEFRFDEIRTKQGRVELENIIK